MPPEAGKGRADSPWHSQTNDIAQRLAAPRRMVVRAGLEIGGVPRPAIMGLGRGWHPCRRENKMVIDSIHDYLKRGSSP